MPRAPSPAWARTTPTTARWCGRWHHADVYHQTDWIRRLIESPPRGPKPNHRHFTVHNYANGRFVYRPNLTDKSTDFADGAFDAHNVRPGPGGLTFVEPGRGHVVFEVRTPYIIVPLVDRGRVSAHSVTLGGVVLNTWDSELWNIADWYRISE